MSEIGKLNSRPFQKRSEMQAELEQALKTLISEGYKLKAQHNNPKWKKALENAEFCVHNTRNSLVPSVLRNPQPR
jgi:hypothetical protein